MSGYVEKTFTVIRSGVSDTAAIAIVSAPSPPPLLLSLSTASFTSSITAPSFDYPTRSTSNTSMTGARRADARGEESGDTRAADSIADFAFTLGGAGYRPWFSNLNAYGPNPSG